VLSNMQAETYEYGIPPIYADPQVWILMHSRIRLRNLRHISCARASRATAGGGVFSSRLPRKFLRICCDINRT